MQHSITFTDTITGENRNTWTDWGIIPKQQPVFATPPVKTNYIDIKGGNGKRDLSTAITGFPVYDDRTGSISFLSPDRWISWLPKFNLIKDFLHGQQLKVELEDEPGWYYEGRFSINQMYCDEQHGTFVLDYELGPFAWSETTAAEPWLWDPFSFVDGVIYNGVYVDTSVTPNKVWHGNGLIGGITVKTTETTLDFMQEYESGKTGNAPLQPTLFAGGGNVTVTIAAGSVSVAYSLTEETSTKIRGLVLYRGIWLYNGRSANVKIYTSSASDVFLSVIFRPGRL